MIADDSHPPLFAARGIVKRFGDFAANRGIDFTIQAGERHALLGQNGAGKSTLVKMMYGVLHPTAGQFLWAGEPVTIRNPAAARALGIGMVFQEFSVFEALTVLENIALALPPEPMRSLAARVADIAEAYGLAVHPDAPAHDLSVGERQRVEVIRCLLQDPKLLIMDEPTSVLTPQEAELLFRTLERLSAEGRAILYISHRLEEVRELCDRATVLRDGEVVAQCDPKQESARSLAEMMIGEVSVSVERTTAHAASDVPKLVVNQLTIPPRPGRGFGLQHVDLQVHGGEIVGIAGVAGEGQAELMDALIGETRVRDATTITANGHALGDRGPTARRQAGMAFVPEQRNGHATVADMRLSENILLSHHRAANLAPRGLIDFHGAQAWATRVQQEFDVRAGSEHPTAGSLSGGNLQKFVVGREILREPAVLVAGQPTWGVDAGAAAVIRQALIELAGRGAAVLVVSQDLDELFEICDRIAVIHRGAVSDLYPVAALTPERVGLLMGGAREELAA